MTQDNPNMDKFLEHYELATARLQGEAIDKDAVMADLYGLISTSSSILMDSTEPAQKLSAHIETLVVAENIVPTLTDQEKAMLVGQAVVYKTLLDLTNKPDQKVTKPTPTKDIKTDAKKGDKKDK